MGHKNEIMTMNFKANQQNLTRGSVSHSSASDPAKMPPGRFKLF